MSKYRSFALVLIASCLTSCDTTKSDESQNESGKGDFSYRAVRIRSDIYLKPLFNDLPPFGPFRQDDEMGTHFVHMPAGRPQTFFSAQQIFHEEESNSWYFTDNSIQMRGLPVDFSQIE